MPKEAIHPSTPQRDDEPLRMAEVGWHANGWVQLGIKTEIRESGESVTGDVVATDLDRQQINNLIRVLRRARDQAYGRDE